MEIIMSAVIDNLVQVIVALVVAMIGVAGTWLTAKIGQNKNLMSIQHAVAEAQNAAQQTVLELQQTVVDGLKASAADGKLTQDEILDLNRELIARSTAKMSTSAVDILNASGVDVTALITGAGEALIAQIKAGTAVG